RIEANHVTALEVVAHDLVGHGKKGLVGAFTTFHARLLADSGEPLIPAGRGIALGSGPRVSPVSRKDVAATPEEGPKQVDLLLVRSRDIERGAAALAAWG